MIWQKKIKQHTYLWSDAEWWFCYYQVVTYVQVSSIHTASSISKLIFWEKDQRSISESQNFSCLNERSWPGLQEIRSNVCCDTSAAASQLPANALCHANFGGSTADAGRTLCSLPLPCPWNSTHASRESCVTSLRLGPSQGRAPVPPAEPQPCPDRWQGCPHITALHVLLITAAGAPAPAPRCVPSPFGSLLLINHPSLASFQPAAPGLLPCYLSASFLLQVD